MDSDSARVSEPGVDDVRLWYHTMELAPNVVTPGWFDLRPIADDVPWPALAGARCLDVATYDGFFAFEMERRGAAEVVATDIPEHADWDWLPRDRAAGLATVQGMAGQKGLGFQVAHRMLGSSARRELVNVYDLDAATIGTFDVVVLGALLLHLRDPFGALEAIRGVCTGAFLSIEQVDRTTTTLFRRRPMLTIQGRRQQWMVPNAAGHRRMLEVAGFEIDRAVSFTEPFGAAHPSATRPPPRSVRARVRRAVDNLQFDDGIATQAVRCHPAPELSSP